MFSVKRAAAAFAAGCALSFSAQAKPIAFGKGTTVMAEYGAGTMNEVQAFYAPHYWYSLGGAWLSLSAQNGEKSRHISTLRANVLAKRWNYPAAQANVFAWGGIGLATGNDFSGRQLSRNIGVQADYETRWIYASARSDLQKAKAFSHRIDTVQLGFAPYPHEYGGLATWLVLQGRSYTGGIYDGVEAALLLRLFKGGTWVEAGVSGDGKLQAMAMFNF